METRKQGSDFWTQIHDMTLQQKAETIVYKHTTKSRFKQRTCGQNREIFQYQDKRRDRTTQNKGMGQHNHTLH